MAQLFANNAEASLSGAISQGAVTAVLSSGTGAAFPSPTGGDFFIGTFFEKDESGNEVYVENVKVTARNTDTLTIERDFESMTGNAGGYSFPSAAGKTVFFDLRWSAFAAGNAEQKTSKDASGGYAGLTLFKLNLRNAANTITSFVTSATTAVRTWTMPDKDGTVAMLGDIPVIPDAETGASIRSKLGITTLSGSNTGDQELPTLSSLGAQAALVSGANIKTIGGASLLGSGNIDVGGAITLSGSLSIYVTQSTALTITNYDSSTSYSVTATGGTVSISGDTITYTAGSSAGSFAVNITAGSSLRAVAVTVNAAAIAAPGITTPTSGATGLGQAPTITTGAFSYIGVADTHLNTDWEIRTAASGGGTLITSSLANSSNKTSWAVPGGLLAVATTYYARARHRGTTLGAGAWSEASFTTAATFGGLIGTQGGQGFGVGEYVGTLPSGFSAMTGTSDKSSANYGNYQYSDGSVLAFVPKFFYRIGNAASPRYATYGANALDVVGIDVYANETAANAAGYAMHRAFYDGGSEKSGFFIDKYLASKTSTTSCKSIENADPISLTTNASYNPSSTQTGCTGILADAVVLARSRSSGLFNVASVFMYSALAMLALAHAQAATGTTNCAWYDAGGTTNFPKGCNNGALADTNDATVTYAASYSTKPKTRATANFAKTTHNGQGCGVADLNGSMYQVMLGITSAGANATDSAAQADGNCYVLKRSVALASLTGGYGGANDAWGTAGNLAVNYDSVAGLMPWGGTSGTVYFGNGTTQVFSGATSGTSYQRTACGIQDTTSGASAAGTNQFGNDYCYQYNTANLFPYASGNWHDAADAGVFCRNWNNVRSGGGSYAGFRCAAYGS